MPSYELMNKIAILFKTSIDYLIGLSTNPAPTHSDYKSLSATEIKTNLANRLIELRGSHNEKPNDLALALKLNDRTVRMYRDSTRPMLPSYETLAKIANHYVCSVESLLN
jgi:transcriptional regulator with XRE-family HTH domain